VIEPLSELFIATIKNGSEKSDWRKPDPASGGGTPKNKRVPIKNERTSKVLYLRTIGK